MSTIREIVVARLKELDRGPGTAERIGGLGKNYISDIVRGEKTDVRSSFLPRLAKAMDWSEEEMRERMSVQEETAPSVVVAEGISPPMPISLPKDIPVRGIAAGSVVGAFVIDGTIDWVRRPPGLSHTANAYALYVAGTSMSPKFEPGDLVFVNPDRPPAPGDIVVIQTCNYDGAAVQAWIKILVRTTAEKVTVRQINPESTIDHSREVVRSIHRVMKMSELFGV